MIRNPLSLVPAVLTALLLAPDARAAPSFAADFQDCTLRVDYHHYGNADEEKIALADVWKEGAWAGSRTHLTDWPDYGKYRYKVVDAETNRSLFEMGYSTLFGEWQTTDEAREVSRVFHETVRFPCPRRPVMLEIHSRNDKGRLQRVFTQRIDPASHRVRLAVPLRDVEVLTLADGGEPATALDVVIVADGYAHGQLEKARRDLKRYAQVLLATEPFVRHAKGISVRGVIPVSQLGGPDEPRKGVFRGPAAGSTFNTFDSARYLTTTDNRRLRDLAGQAPYDAIMVLVNSSRYGGAGIYNFFSIFVSDNEYDEYVFVHEFGHGFAALGDEYYTSSVAYSDFYPRGVEPWEPNITAALDGPQNVKWKADLTPDTPLPTPEEPVYADRVGVFEGAGYSAKGLFRPALDCRMFSKKELEFCPVCMAAVDSMIRFYME